MNEFQCINVNDPGFVPIKNETARDGRLSDKALGMLVYLLSHGSEYKISHDNLMRRFGISRGKSVATCRELEQLGYLEISPIRNAAGQLRGWRWTVYGVSQQPDAVKSKKPKSVKLDYGSPKSKTPKFGKLDYIKNTNQEENQKTVREVPPSTPASFQTETATQKADTPEQATFSAKLPVKNSTEKETGIEMSLNEGIPLPIQILLFETGKKITDNAGEGELEWRERLVNAFQPETEETLRTAIKTWFKEASIHNRLVKEGTLTGRWNPRGARGITGTYEQMLAVLEPEMDDSVFGMPVREEAETEFDLLVSTVLIDEPGTMEVYNQVKENFLGSNPTTKQLEEIEKYERSQQFKQYFAA